MKHPSLVRDQLLTLIAGPKGALEHLRIRLSMYASDEVEVLRQLERPQAFDLGVDIVNVVMQKLGHDPVPARELTDADVERARDMRRGGKTLEEIAEYLGVSRGAITRRLQDPRFDKGRRARNKSDKQRGRGVLTEEDKALLAGAAKEPT